MTNWLSPITYLDRMKNAFRAEEPEPIKRDLTVEEVDAALLSLPELERAVFLNHRLGNMPYETMAEKLGISVEEVQAIMVRAMMKLTLAFRNIRRKRRPWQGLPRLQDEDEAIRTARAIGAGCASAFPLLGHDHA